MVNYKDLFYRSQSELSNAIDTLESVLDDLKNCMMKCEEEVISKKQNEIKIYIKKQNK